jgi:hypothetical protein
VGWLWAYEKAGRDALDGVKRLADGSDVAIVRVRAAPVKDAANQAMIAVLAGALKIPKRSVTIVAGGKVRQKQVHIGGDGNWLSGRIAAWPRLS